MKYLILGYVTESGRQLTGPDLEAWMQEIGAWYEKWGSSGKLVDPGHQLDSIEKVKTIKAGEVFDGPFMESKEVLGGYSVLETDTIDEAVRSPGPGLAWIATWSSWRSSPSWRCSFCDATGEQLAFGRVGGQRERSLVGLFRLVLTAELGEQLGSHRVKQPV